MLLTVADQLPTVHAVLHPAAQITATGPYSPLCTFLETMLTMLWCAGHVVSHMDKSHMPCSPPSSLHAPASVPAIQTYSTL